ncbi:MAG: hypothetical protein HGA19_24865 [Oscillochloris sp.]|nr:hypothetical protein [Oscillochloris sp.]
MILGILTAIGAALLVGYQALYPVAVLHLAEITEHGVHVDISLERRWISTPVLVARYTPDEPRGHLYATNLPREGVNGVGRPTLLEIPPQPGMRAVGSLSADHSPLIQQMAGLSAPLSIYPDGPISLRLPITYVAGPATLSVTYMACSSEGYCMPPVIDRKVTVIFPGDTAE